MTSPELRERLVLGGGPVGLAAALAGARRGRVTLSTRGDPSPEPFVESVPVATVMLLGELGVSPSEMGATGPFRERTIAWESPEPAHVEGVAAVHIVRGALDDALARRVASETRISGVGPLARADLDAISRRRSSSRVVFDATGRRAITATTPRRPPAPLVARLFTFRAEGSDPAFGLAAFPLGYAYRIGALDLRTVGWVGPRRHLPRSVGALLSVLRAVHAAWLLEGIDAASLCSVTSRIASLQWTEATPGEGVLRLGDAALAKDALASSGLASGLADAMYATSSDPRAIVERHASERARHAQSLGEHVDRAVFAAQPDWATYRAWLRAGEAEGPPREVALRGGRIESVSPISARAGGSGRAFPAPV